MHPKIRRGEIDPLLNLGVLSNEFLEFYGKYFNYSGVGISVLDGGTYFSKKRRGWGGKSSIQLSIEDPCDISASTRKHTTNFIDCSPYKSSK
jgi:non-canonical poly(A) RNA polymerase PAPD5/7